MTVTDPNLQTANALAVAHIARVRGFLARNSAKIRDKDEFESIAMSVLVDASRTFIPVRGLPFRAYLERSLRYALLDSIRRAYRQHITGTPIHRITKDHRRTLGVSLEIKEDVASAVALMSGRERLVIWGRYFEGMTIKQVSMVTGIGRERVRETQHRAIARVRRLIGVEAKAA